MKLKKFFKILNSYYESGLGGYMVKFYAQSGSFSFELHDRDKIYYTPGSIVFESDIYYDWVDCKHERKKILQDIVAHCGFGDNQNVSD